MNKHLTTLALAFVAFSGVTIGLFSKRPEWIIPFIGCAAFAVVFYTAGYARGYGSGMRDARRSAGKNGVVFTGVKGRRYESR